MNRKSLLLVPIILVGLALACGPCGVIGNISTEIIEIEEGGSAATRPAESGPEVGPTRPAGVEATPVPPSGDEPAPRPQGVFRDVPMYPGATPLMEGSAPPVPGGTGWYQDVETLFLETQDSVDQVCGFYEDGMPGAAWDEVLNMPVDQGCMSSWLSSDGDIGVTIVIGEGPEGKVVISMVGGKVE